MGSAVIYTRVSTGEQVQNYSLATQEKACREWCARNDLNVDRVFREEGESAKTADRPKLQELLEYCAESARARGIEWVVVYKVDRLARQTWDHMAITMALRLNGVQLRAVLESFDDSPIGRFTEHVMSGMAQLDNDLRAQRTKEGMREALSRGRWLQRAPIGYRKPADPKWAPSLIPDEEMAPLVVRSFELAALGELTTKEIWHQVSALGLKTSRGKQLSEQAFGRMLTNVIYTGRIVSPGFDFEGPGDFEAIVSDELFASAQIGRRRSAQRDGRHRDHKDFPLRRVMKCGRCSSPLTGSWSRGRNRVYPYYRCHQRGCGGVSVRKEKLEEVFIDWLESITLRDEAFALLEAVIRDVWAEHVGDAARDRGALVGRQRDVEDRIDRLIQKYNKDAIDEPDYRRHRRQLQDELDIVVDQIESIGACTTDLEAVLAFGRVLLTDLSGCWNRTQWEDRPGLLRALFPQGLIYDNEAIGTTETPWLMGASGVDSSPDERWAPPTGFEPVLPP
ncbi:MAG: recombinase family protein [Acidimicrobiales bacterium]